jgi:hypothetical protein
MSQVVLPLVSSSFWVSSAMERTGRSSVSECCSGISLDHEGRQSLPFVHKQLAKSRHYQLQTDVSGGGQTTPIGRKSYDAVSRRGRANIACRSKSLIVEKAGTWGTDPLLARVAEDPIRHLADCRKHPLEINFLVSHRP